MVSQMPGYEAVQSWFVQAVPTVSKYVALGRSRKVLARFKVIAPLHDLCLPITGDSSVVHYLCSNPTFNSSPMDVPQMITKDLFWVRQVSTTQHTIFQPQTYRAPVLQGFQDFNIGASSDTKYGVLYNNDFANANWNIIAPFTDIVRLYSFKLFICTD